MRRRYGGRLSQRQIAAAVAGGALIAVVAHHPTGPGPTRGTTMRTAVAATAIVYAEAQLGKPYLWGGTGPDAFDCSGLVMEAYAAAGVSIPRTSQEQWARGPHVTTPEPGDLVFFAGADGTASLPGHVGLVVGNGQMIEAYATGFPVRISAYGTASAPPGDENPVGFADPAGHARAS